ncbi:hypothetical protein [Nocardia sp. NPDC049707]|uniref:hypothetical protein n=1 Tax=Nocardia sp. NPDC049707 TaxID=3154735 RepID=UPI00343D3425
MRLPASRMPTAAAYRPDSRDAGIRRYFGLTQFALMTGVPVTKLSAWRHGTSVWVPTPDIDIGDHGGWSLTCIRAWAPDRKPFGRPQTTLLRRHRHHPRPLPRHAHLHPVGVRRRGHHPPAGRVGRQPTGLAVMTGFDDCHVDPGVLTSDDAVHAMSIHHSCPEQCWPRRRVDAALDAEYTAQAFPPRSSSHGDTHFAALVREAIRLAEKASRVRQPVERR